MKGELCTHILWKKIHFRLLFLNNVFVLFLSSNMLLENLVPHFLLFITFNVFRTVLVIQSWKTRPSLKLNVDTFFLFIGQSYLI